MKEVHLCHKLHIYEASPSNVIFAVKDDWKNVLSIKNWKTLALELKYWNLCQF